MIVEYHRPKKIKDALDLIGRSNITTIPLAGGTALCKNQPDEQIEVVDLQDLPINTIDENPDWIEIGAMVKLALMENHQSLPSAIRHAVTLEGTTNTRNMATVGGRLIEFDGRSSLITTLLAMDATTKWDQDEKEIPLGEWLAFPPQKPGKLLRSVLINRNCDIAFEAINRTKLDLPIICVAVSHWKSGRTRVTLGGFGQCPKMVFDGQDISGIEEAVKSACHDASDRIASSEYRRSIAKTLVKRCLKTLQGQ
ncbi:MAG: FAD binding domain-containing protein [Anaerolineaceae bacterium]|nr:FAD binding domain-containing protein [Anaerolineaceae bacterium]